ncbi:MAG: CNNM domain-containing protein [Patescibacteria group bacterium]|nr:CNNM domain-containing protein [Patescibacteria group bacterium]
MVIIFGEIIPKKFAILYPVFFSRATAHLIEFCRIITFSILIPIVVLNKALDKMKKNDHEESRKTLQEEIIATLGIGHIKGALESKECQMVNKLLLLNDREVSEIMTRRNDIVAIKSDAKLRELIALASETNLSRIPVYKNSIDTIEYVIHTPHLNRHLLIPENLDQPVHKFCQTIAYKVPETKILDDLFFEFQTHRIHMAIVLDEFGNTSGLITLEDIIEQIFGKIEDETDVTETLIEKLDGTAFKAHGEASIHEFEEISGITLPKEYPKHRSMSWLILDILHRFPKEGEVVEVPGTGLQITVIDMDD